MQGASYWAPGIVVENEGISEYKYFSKENAPLVVLAENNGIDLSIQRIDKEIVERVMWPGKNRINLEKLLSRQNYSSSKEHAKEEAVPSYVPTEDRKPASGKRGYWERISKRLYGLADFLSGKSKVVATK